MIKAVAKGNFDKVVDKLVAKAVGAGTAGDKFLDEMLKKVNCTLLKSFSVEETEAILVRLESETNPILILVFRGTEKELTDIKTDLTFNLVDNPSGGRVHKGFLKAFEHVKKPIKHALQEYHDGEPLYIAGHSLGGALALLAAKEFASDSTGAVYTFGAPRAADDEFYKDIRTPVYRVVNAADGVARIPFGWGSNILLALLRYIPINGTRNISEYLRKRYMGYTHEGHLIFLSDASSTPDEKGIPYKQLRVEPSPNYFWRANQVIKRLLTTKCSAAATDHSISTYCLKLSAHAHRNLPDKV